MEILDNYLDTMFSRYPLTPKTEEAKRELRAMMEDAYNGALAAGRSPNEALGQAISEFGNIDEVAPILGLDPTRPTVVGNGSFPEGARGPSMFGADDTLMPASSTSASSRPSSSSENQSEASTVTDPRAIPPFNAAPSTSTAPASGRTSFPLASTNSTQSEARTGGMPAAFPSSAPTYGDTAGSWGAPKMTDRRPISLAQAKNYAEVMKRTRWMLGIAVALLVISPTALIGFAVAFPDDQSPRYALGLIVGFTVLLPLVGVGVGLLVWRGQQLAPFRRITESTDACTREVEAFAAALDQEHSSARTRNLIIAIGLWILSALPVIATGVFTSGWDQELADPLLAIGVVATLVLVAVGLLVFLPSDWAHSAAISLRQTSPNTEQAEYFESGADRYPAWVRALMAGFWPLMAAVYLAWSFLTWDWGTSWIIWPVAGVTFATFAAVVGAVYPPKRPGA